MAFNVLILPKEDALEVARAATTRLRVPTDALALHIFCDASYKRGSPIRGMKPRAALGVVGNIWLPLALKNERTTKGCFIPCDHPNDDNYTVEALALVEGACLALDKIASYEARSAIGPDDKVEIIFWSDCQTVLLEIGHRGGRPRIPMRLRHMIDMIELKTLDIQRSRKNVSVQFFWCPQECVEPHETADHLSKAVRVGGGSGTRSKALNMLHSLTHSDIRSALEQAHRDVRTDASIPAIADGFDIIRSAARYLSNAHREIVLAATELQEMANALQAEAQTRTQNQVQDSDNQGHNSTGHRIERGNHIAGPEGEDHEQDGRASEDEDIFYDAPEVVAGDGVGRPSRVRAVWNWMRGRPRL